MKQEEIDAIDDEICRIMIEHGPDRHVDGHDRLTEFVVSLLDGPRKSVGDQICDGINAWEDHEDEKDAAVAAEREACAEILDDFLSKWANDMDEEQADDLRGLRDKIRERGSDCEHCCAEARSEAERARDATGPT